MRHACCGTYGFVSLWLELEQCKVFKVKTIQERLEEGDWSTRAIHIVQYAQHGRQHGAQIRQSGRQTAEQVEVPFMMMTNTLLGLIVSPTFVLLSSPVPTRTPVVQAVDPFLNPVFTNPDVMSAGPVVAHIQYGALATGLLVITAH